MPLEMNKSSEVFLKSIMMNEIRKWYHIFDNYESPPSNYFEILGRIEIYKYFTSSLRIAIQYDLIMIREKGRRILKKTKRNLGNF